MTPDDIKSQRFGTRLLRGLRPEEVSAFLEDVAEAYGDVQKWNTELMERVESLQNELRALTAHGKEASASTHIETLRTATLREVEALVHDAQGRAQALIDGAKEERSRHTARSRGVEGADAERGRGACGESNRSGPIADHDCEGAGNGLTRRDRPPGPKPSSARRRHPRRAGYLSTMAGDRRSARSGARSTRKARDVERWQ